MYQSIYFLGMDELTVCRWLLGHGIIEANCGRTGCSGQGIPVNDGKEKLAIKCQQCRHVSKVIETLH